jgi:hypothetical protein
LALYPLLLTTDLPAHWRNNPRLGLATFERKGVVESASRTLFQKWRGTMTLDEVIAREDIRHATNAYMAGADAFFSDECHNVDLVLAQLAGDVILEFAEFPPLPGFRCQGIEEVRAMFGAWTPPAKDPTLRGSSFVRHNITTCHIELTGKDTATAKTYFIVMTDIGPDHAGNYSDNLVKKGDRWLFVHRRIALLWRSPRGCFPPVKR